MTRTTRAADLLVQALATAGIERLFTLSGNQIMPVFDACFDAGVDLVHVRHEAAAVHMADAWGRLTGRPGVALLTAGPGLANGLSAMYVALAAESPVVVISGHAPQERLGWGAFQELAQAEMAGHVTKASWTAADPAKLGHDLARAFRTACSGRPGPVHFCVPSDVLSRSGDRDRTQGRPSPDDFHPLLSLLDARSAEAILAALTEAQRPLVLAGPAMCRGDGPECLRALAEATSVPCVWTESPRGVLDPSLGAIAEVLAQADLVVLIGKRLDFSLKFGASPPFADGCRFIQVDPDPRVLEQTVRVLGDESRLVLADVADALPAVERLVQLAEQHVADAAGVGRKAGRFPDASPSVEAVPRSEESNTTARQGWFDDVQNALAWRPPEWQSLASPVDGPIHPAEVCRTIAAMLAEADESVFISDGGEFGQWAQAIVSPGSGTSDFNSAVQGMQSPLLTAAPTGDLPLVEFTELKSEVPDPSRHRVINGPSGAIGGGIPFALAARLAFPDARIALTLGDGTFGFHAMEFDTAVRDGLPFVAIVGNDACWNAERQIQLRDYGAERLIGCDLLPTRYDEVVRAMGGHGEYVTRPDKLAPALTRAFASGLPACVNVAIPPEAAPVIRRSGC